MTASGRAAGGPSLPREIFEAEHDDFREAVRGFLTAHAVPHTERWEAAGMVDRDFWRAAAKQGFVAFAAPEEHGGLGISDYRFNAVIAEEVAYAGVVGDNFTLVNDIVAPYLTDLADADQQARWLPPVTAGDIVPAIAMSEPGAGSDLKAIHATATWRDGHYELSGSKTFVTSGIQAELVIVLAHVVREGVEGMGLFVVEEGMEGFRRGRKLEKVGRRAQDTAELFFDAVAVGERNVIGAPGEGLRLLMGNLAQERLGIAVTAVAASERALELTAEYVRERRAFGATIGRLQATRFKLAELSAEVAAARAHVDRCIAAQVAGRLTAVQAAAVKLITTELQWRTIDACVQLHGGYGYMEEYEIARMWRDARVQRIYGGANEVMLEVVGRSLAL